MKVLRLLLDSLQTLWGDGLVLQAVLPAPTNSHDLPLLLAQGSDSDEKRTVRAGRRRGSGSTPAGDRERAEAPQRRQPSGQGAPPSGGGGARPPAAPRPMGGGLPAGMPRSPLLMIGLLVLLAVCLIPVLLLGGGEDVGDIVLAPPPPASQQQFVEPTATTALATATPRPTRDPSLVADGETWLVMLYQDADDKILERDIYVDLNEAERIGSSDTVHIVTQMDRYRAGYQGDGDWTSTKRFYVVQDADLDRVRSQEVADLGEANMASGETLVDFVTWAMASYPADKHVLILSDHGMGWPGGWSDPTARGGVERGIPLSSALGDQLYLHELDEALGEIRSRTGLDKFELIGMDACLMSHMEVFSALAPHARFAVASQETEPALGWAYTAFLEDLLANPAIDGGDLGRLIVASYIDEDQRIVDDQARLAFAGRGSPMGGLFGAPTAQQLAEQLGRSITLTAIDLEQMPALTAGVNSLASALQNADQRAVTQARSYAQSFTSIFGREVPPSYVDLGNFAQRAVQATRDSDVAQAAEQVMAALGSAVIAERHGPNKQGATGVSIYFPNSQLYGSPVAGPQSYTAVARRFADESLWDDFLAFHYTGRRFEPSAGAVAVPEPGQAIRGPGAGDITVSPLSLSGNVAAPGQPVLLSADISGDHVGYVKLFVGFYDRASNSIFMADTDYLDSPEIREIDGVYYPDWGEGDFTLEFEWEPIVFAIADGTDSAVALFNPEDYGKSRDEAVYTVDGIYTYADGGESRYARLYFQNGVLQQAFGFTGEDATGAPREIIPSTGDTFTILERWLDLDQSGQIEQVASQEGDTLTFGDQMFTWQELDAAPGDYVVGFIVEDLDGNGQAVYEQVRVE